MEKALIRMVIQKSLEQLYLKDALLMESSYDINERTVTHRLAIYLESYFSKDGYVVDVEYNRMRGDKVGDAVGNLMSKRLNWEQNEQGSSYVYPDIIVHKRDTDDNLLLLEVKMSWKCGRKSDDFLKINEYIKEIGYKYAVYLELSPNIENCEVLFGPFT